MPDKSYEIRRMRRDEMENAIDWAAAEGWNPGINDGDCFYSCDPQGFFIGELAGEPAGCISAVGYGPTFGFMGFYIVKPEYRGQGLGLKLWKAAMDYMGDRVIGLDGVPAQQNNYVKSGFKTAYRSIRFEGIAADHRREQSKEIVELSELPLPELAAYDNRMFPASRQEFIKRWINLQSGAALGYMSGRRLKGYGVIRACRSGYKIGPLFADQDHIAEALLKALMSTVNADAQVFLDVPEVNGAALDMAGRYKMRAVFETARMYRGQPPQVDLNGIYGVSSFELG